jgi:hypothetical protein
MTAAANTAEIIGLFDCLDTESKSLVFEIINGMARGRLTCKVVEVATERMLAGDNKLEVLEDLVQISNERLIEEATPDE